MKKSFLPAFLLAFFLSQPFPAQGAEITAPDVRVAGGDIIVSAVLSLDANYLEDIRNGIAKEISFRFDLFRVWKNWPDEFITRRNIIRTLECDPVKKEHVGTSFDGSVLLEKRFKHCETLLNWAAAVRDLKIAATGQLESSTYIVKVSVESRIRKQPSVIGYLFFFVPENEFKISKESPPLTTGSRQ